MILRSIASAFPDAEISQKECWERIQSAGVLETLRPGSQALLRKLLLNDNGIEARRLAVDDLGYLKSACAGDLNRTFEREAPRLASRALRAALAKVDLSPDGIDALFVCTCTGYLCPGVSSYVAEAMGLGESTCLHDLVGQGCGAAIPLLRAGAGYLRQHPGHRIACIAVEICSAAFFVDDDPGVLVSLALFGDGASASLWEGEVQGKGTGYRCAGFDSLHWPQHRESLRFANERGYLRNQLDRSVPATAARAVRTLFDRNHGGAPAHVLSHTGGRDVIDAIENELAGYRLDEARAVLRRYGNTSSPAVLLALEAHLSQPRPERDLWLVSFGAGFTCHGLRLHYDPG